MKNHVFIRFHQISSDFIRFHQISSDFIRFHFFKKKIILVMQVYCEWLPLAKGFFKQQIQFVNPL